MKVFLEAYAKLLALTKPAAKILIAIVRTNSLVIVLVVILSRVYSQSQ